MKKKHLSPSISCSAQDSSLESLIMLGILL